MINLFDIFSLSKLTPFSTHIATYMHTKTGTHYMNACTHTLMHINTQENYTIVHNHNPSNLHT